MHDGSESFLADLAATGLSGLRIATFAGFTAEGWPEVETPTGRLRARSLAALAPTDRGREAAVAFTAEGALILGLIRPPVPVAEADGEQIVLDARSELTLRCGKASITLKPDGRVTIRGTQILSRAEGANRVQGASVQLN